MGPVVDRLVVAQSASASSSVTVAVFLVIGLFAVAGLVLLARASRTKRLAGDVPAGARSGSGSVPAETQTEARP